MQTVKVELGSRSYVIRIGSGIRSLLAGLLSEHMGDRQAGHIRVVADETVAKLHLEAIRDALGPDLGGREPLIQTVPAGEASKSLEMAGRLYQWLADGRIDRSDLILVLGGGVVGDLGGFVAGTWHRGVPFVQIPTTLEAAVDASVGGKTGVNLPAGKNLVGVFHQPVTVLIDTDFLATLPQRDFVAGLAESVKHAAIRSEAFLAWQEQHAEGILAREPAVLEELIGRNCRIKAEVVGQDEREAGLRAILNYGHTVGHAVEHLLGYELRHGECIALGMIVAGELSCRQAGLDRASAERIRNLIARLGLPTRPPRAVDPDDVLRACRQDKKNRAGGLRFVLLESIGRPLPSANVGEADIAGAISAIVPSAGGGVSAS
jgi:3-dehydroquinate synthase